MLGFDMKRLLLIDGNAILHRAYHALPPLTNSKGEVVNGVYGFFSMLLTVMNDLKPECVVVCFDRQKPTFRQTMYAGYQQHRPKMADDLVPQVGILHGMLAKMKVAVFEVDGYEADDLIGTIAAQAVKAGPVSRSLVPSLVSPLSLSDLEVIILSGDRDMLQLVNGRVEVLAPVVGVKNTILYDSAKVEEKYGITPGQVVDYKALVGDASDGYPGVAGVGPKTAAHLLQNYRTLESIYEHIGELNPKLALKLAQGSEQAALCKRLATIILDAPVTFKLEECLVSRFAIADWVEAFREQGFKSLTGRAETFFGVKATSMDASPNIKKKKEKRTEGQLGLLD
jgi:DNA polymerase-1